MRFVHFFSIYTLLSISIVGCKDHTNSTARTSHANDDSVKQMMSRISKDVTAKGPIAWLEYFEKTPRFFMASEGAIAFPDNDAASKFISTTLVKQVRRMKLEWRNVRIDSLNETQAAVGANWLENMTDSTGETHLQSGYFTAVAEHTKEGWKLRNAHWSAISPVD